MHAQRDSLRNLDMVRARMLTSIHLVVDALHMLAVQQTTGSTPFAAPDAVAGGAGLADHVHGVGCALPRLRPLAAVRVQVPARSDTVTMCEGASDVLSADRHGDVRRELHNIASSFSDAHADHSHQTLPAAEAVAAAEPLA